MSVVLKLTFKYVVVCNDDRRFISQEDSRNWTIFFCQIFHAVHKTAFYTNEWEASEDRKSRRPWRKLIWFSCSQKEPVHSQGEKYDVEIHFLSDSNELLKLSTNFKTSFSFLYIRSVGHYQMSHLCFG